MSKIIVSSYSLYHFLANSFVLSDFDEFSITGNKEKSELKFNSNVPFLCEISTDFEFKTTGQHLKALRDVLGKTTDQPVTLTFKGSINGWITINHIEV